MRSSGTRREKWRFSRMSWTTSVMLCKAVTIPWCRECVSNKAINEASRILPVKTMIDMPRKWLIRLSSAVSRSSPTTFPRCQIGWVVGSGNSHLLMIPLNFSCRTRSVLRQTAKCFAGYPAPALLKTALPAERGQRLFCRALSSKTSAASRLRLIVAAVSARFFCAYCFNVKTDAVLSNSQTRVIEITTLITLIRRSARLKVGRGA